VLPEAKRRYGYFCLPVLWDGNWSHEWNAKQRGENFYCIFIYLALEPGLVKTDALALYKELISSL